MAGEVSWYEQLHLGGRYRLDWTGDYPYPMTMTITVRHREVDPLLGPRVYGATDEGIAVWLGGEDDMRRATITPLSALTDEASSKRSGGDGL